MSEIKQEEIDYLKELVNERCSSKWRRAKIELKLDESAETLKKSFKVGKFCGLNIVKFYEQKIRNGYLENEEYMKLERLEEKIYKERVRLQDANREKHKYLRSDGRFESLLEIMKNEMCNLPIFELKEYSKVKEPETKYATLCLSDWHCGSKVNNEFNKYNIEIMIDRAATIKNKAIEKCKLHKITDLFIEINGDMVDGLIHVSSRVEQEEGVITQIIKVSDVLSKMINELKPHFNTIKVVTTLGNHARLTPSKYDSVTKENFEALIPVFLRDRLQDIEIIESNGLDFASYEVDGRTIIVAHGQNDNLARAVPDYSKVFHNVPSEVHMGHTHGYKDINDCDVYININGSLIGSDEFALTLRKVTSPAQNLIIYGQDRCVYELKANC